MVKQMLAVLLIGALCLSSGRLVSAAASHKEKDARFAAKVKQGIQKLGVGTEARTRIKLRDQTHLTGYVSETGPDSFILVEANTGKTTTVAYADVAQVQGQNLSTRTKVILGVSIVAAAVIVLYLVRGAFCDGC